MNKISQTLNCKKICEERKLKKLPVYDAGLGANSIKQPNYFIKSLQEFADKKNYTPSEGVPELQKTIKKLFSTKKYSVENLIVGNGLKELLFLVQMSFKGKIFHITPSWVSYKEQIKLLHRECDLIEIETKIEDNFKIDLYMLEKYLEKNKNENKLLILNNPNNPTGLIYTENEIKRLSELLKIHNCMVLADEIYFDLTHYNKIVSICDYLPDLTIRGSSVSKNLGCGGYRIGWITFPKKLDNLFNKCLASFSSIASCASTPLQYAVHKMLENRKIYKNHCNLNNRIYKIVAKKTCNILEKSDLKFVRPNSSWYIMLDFSNYKDRFERKGIKTSIDLCNFLIKEIGLVSVAGQHFNINTFSIRISLISINKKAITKKGEIQEGKIFNHMEEGFTKLVKLLNKL